jgi:hypothetical protein
VLNTGIVVSMSKSPRVTFKYSRVSASDWQIEAHYTGAEIRNLKGKAEIDDWLRKPAHRLTEIAGYAK